MSDNKSDNIEWGVQIILPIAKLKVDRASTDNPLGEGRGYQRDPVPSVINEIQTEGIKPKLFGALSVDVRDEFIELEHADEYWVTDGANRLLAAKNLGLQEIPCLVYRSEGRKSEANNFINQDKRASLSPFNKYNAELCAKNKLYLEIDQWLKSAGLEMTAGGSYSGISFVNLFIKRWERDKHACQLATIAQKKLCKSEEKRLVAPIHGGFWILESRGIYQKYTRHHITEFIDKILIAGGSSAIIGTYNAIRLDEGHSSYGGSNAEVVYARATLKVINKGKKSRRLKMGE